MNKRHRVLLLAQWWGAGILSAGLLLWGGLRAYCHFHGKMSESVSGARTAEEDHPLIVTVVRPIHRPAIRSVTLPATVEAFEKATLYAKVAGYLEWIKVDMGDRVRRGEILALIQVPETEKEYQRARAAAQEAQASYERAQADMALKKLTFKRLEGIRQSQPDVISPQEVDVARAAAEVAQSDVEVARAKQEVARYEVGRLEVLTEYAKIRSPYCGVVTARFVDPGALIQSATSSRSDSAAILTVIDMDRVRVHVNVPEPDVSYIDRGDPVEVELDGLPGRVFRSNIKRFATALDPQTRTMQAEIEIANRGHLIRPGMFGKARLQLAEEAEALFLPAESVRVDATGKKFVYSVAEGRIRKVTVETGLDDGKLVQVKGLRGDETLVLTSTEKLEEGLPVTVAKAAS